MLVLNLVDYHQTSWAPMIRKVLFMVQRLFSCDEKVVVQPKNTFLSRDMGRKDIFDSVILNCVQMILH